MKLVQATFPHFQLSEITEAIRAAGAAGATSWDTVDVRFLGPRERRALYITLETVVHDDLVDRVVEAIVRAGQRLRPSDGSIVVLPVDGAVGIRTGAIDEAAIAP